LFKQQETASFFWFTLGFVRSSMGQLSKVLEDDHIAEQTQIALSIDTMPKN